MKLNVNFSHFMDFYNDNFFDVLKNLNTSVIFERGDSFSYKVDALEKVEVNITNYDVTTFVKASLAFKDFGTSTFYKDDDIEYFKIKDVPLYLISEFLRSIDIRLRGYVEFTI